jgi:transposase
MEKPDTKKARSYIRRTWPDDVTLHKRLAEFERLSEEKKALRKDINSRMPDDPYVKILEKVVGIGRQTAVQIMSMIIDPARFENGEKICAYFGMVPKVHDSGGKKYHGRMTKSGDKMMRMIMERVTAVHVQHCDSSITRYYKKKLPEMGVKKALISASRKMLAALHAALLSRRDFRTA